MVQVAGVPIFISTWGLHLYGEWLILTAVPAYLAFSDIGFASAAGNEMIMAVGRDDRSDALAIFRVASLVAVGVFAVVALALPAIVAAVPLASLLNLSIIHHFTAGYVVVVLGFDALLALYASVLYGGYACEGHYAEGAVAIAAIALVEFLALATAVLLGGDPAIAATAMLGARSLGTAAMYLTMRHYAPWLKLGKPEAPRKLLRRLLSPALASGAFPFGLSINLQGMVILVGAVSGPASAAVFSTLRTLSRAVTQLLTSIVLVVAPEISRAFGAGDVELVRMLHRRGCQTAVWFSGLAVGFLVAFGAPILHLWTSGKVGTMSGLFYLFLAIAAIDSVWFMSLSLLFGTNRHQRVAINYVVANVVTLPIGYVLLKVMGLTGATLSVVLLEVYMLIVVLHSAIPMAHDTLKGWIKAVREPPFYVLSALRR